MQREQAIIEDNWTPVQIETTSYVTLRYDGRLSKKGRRVDALALRADERRDKLR